MDAGVPLRIAETSGRWRLVATGAWTAANVAAIDAAIAALPVASAFRPATLYASGVGQLDTFGACLIARLRGRWQGHGQRLEIEGLGDRHRALVDAVPMPSGDVVAARRFVPPMAAWVADVGRAVEDIGRDLVQQLHVLGAVVSALGQLMRHPQSFRATSFVHHLDRVGWQAVPIVLLITFLIGSIIAQQGFFHFRKFGADAYVVDMVGILMLREIGVLIVAIMVAGRSGSAYTAELGSMKMREEIDALRTMGLDPVDVLVLPRILALLVALPLLAFLGAISSLLGGALVAWTYGGMSPEIFIARLREAISLTHFEVGMIKAPFMALVIGIVASAEGFRVGGSTDSLGRQTTSSVVKSIFMVIILDGLFAIFFASIGM